MQRSEHFIDLLLRLSRGSCTRRPRYGHRHAAITKIEGAFIVDPPAVYSNKSKPAANDVRCRRSRQRTGLAEAKEGRLQLRETRSIVAARLIVETSNDR
jgi:hypothetical protein